MESATDVKNKDIPVIESEKDVSVVESEKAVTDVENKKSVLAVDNVKPELLAKVAPKIIKQLEYYFSDTNLPYDKFLQNEIKTGDGWVKISVLLTFKRLASISKEPAVIAAAVKNATNCIVEINEGNDKIRRKPDQVVPVADQEFLNEMMERSIYCKGFPKTATMDELLNYAASLNDFNITKVIPRRLKTKEFKGSLYFTFETKEQAEKFLKLESVQYGDVNLERKWEKEFLEEKKLEYEEKLAKRDQKQKAETEKYFKKGYLLKANNLTDAVTVDKIKDICLKYEWQVAFVKINEDKLSAWIRLKPVTTAEQLLKDIADKTNDLNITFSLPEENVEQTVLNEMTKEMKEVLQMKDRFKKEKNKNKGGKRFNNKRKNEDDNRSSKKLKTNGN
ncbi:la protein homolog [Adelges cooleyi]|uniref:la protein homolog n=1 Tax=Adelges cooleyi TaxID=133065 RepID=UPI00217F86FC|nr:la protein homolog [Adelges cooleyi]